MDTFSSAGTSLLQYVLGPKNTVKALLFFFFAVLVIELRAYIFNHSTSLFFCDGFFSR
jgi:hypothetical protein